MVDDEGEIRLLARRALESVGCRVYEASNENEAFDVAFRTPELAAVSLDTSMPSMSGGETLEQLRNAGCRRHKVGRFGFGVSGGNSRGESAAITQGLRDLWETSDHG
ncbi:MAG: response regulator [bacterium]|nr:response regulator [bacterium]